jgi:ribonuclease P protein component, eubacterial
MVNTGRLRKNAEFKFVYNKGKVIANSLIVMYFVPNRTSCNKAGFSVSKKVGISVVRNKVRRRLKESYRLNEYRIKKGYNIVFVARVRSNSANYVELQKAMISLFRKAQILVDER